MQKRSAWAADCCRDSDSAVCGQELLPRDDPSLARMRGLLDAARERPAFQTTSQAPEFYIKSYKGYGQEKATTKLEIEAVPASGTSARL